MAGKVRTGDRDERVSRHAVICCDWVGSTTGASTGMTYRLSSKGIISSDVLNVFAALLASAEFGFDQIAALTAFFHYFFFFQSAFL